MNETNELPVFRRATMADASVGNKKRAWKSLKQILATERTLQWQENAVTCKLSNHNKKQLIFIQLNSNKNIFNLSADSSINAPPSFLPAKKYSDISGLIAPYTDPRSKLHYHNAEEFATVRNLPSDLTAGYLALRGASSIVG